MPMGRAVASHLLVHGGAHHIAVGAGRLNSFSQCEIVRSVLHGNLVLGLELLCSAHFRSSWQAVCGTQVSNYCHCQFQLPFTWHHYHYTVPITTIQG